MLEVKNVSKQYRGEDKLLFDAVSDVSLSMEDHCMQFQILCGQPEKMQ